jgi:hypothetical protein
VTNYELSRAVTQRVGLAIGRGESAPRGSQRVSHVQCRARAKHTGGGSFSRKRKICFKRFIAIADAPPLLPPPPPHGGLKLNKNVAKKKKV